MTGGSHLSARGRKEGCTDLVLRGSGPWADSDAWPDGFPGALFYFYFIFFFSFSISISFITFVYINQIRSNQFLNFCKIQHYYLKQ
jgi:hypothetical protein